MRNKIISFFQILALLQKGGASRSNYYSDRVTHLIAGYEALESDISASKDLYEIPAVTQNWILYSAKCKKLLPYPFKICKNYNSIINPLSFYSKYLPLSSKNYKFFFNATLSVQNIFLQRPINFSPMSEHASRKSAHPIARLCGLC